MSNILFNKNNTENEDVWDDTALIKMYEDSIKSEVKQSSSKTGKKSTSSRLKWKVGDRCTAPYEDEEEEEPLWYPAEVVALDEENSKVQVLFDHYGNMEWINDTDLFSSEESEEASERQEQSPQKPQCTPSTSRSQESRRSGSSHISAQNVLPRFAPPPPPAALTGLVPPNEVEALSSMLMSWYMSGYHTGYYQCLTDMKSKNNE